MQQSTIGVLVNIGPHGGGSHQWTMNILHALERYQHVHPSLKIVLVHYPNYNEDDILMDMFPSFRREKIKGFDFFLTRIMRRLAVAMPWLIPLLRSQIFPLNRLLRQKKIDCVIFSVTVLDSALCDVPNVFFAADILHRFYPNFIELGGPRGVKLRDAIFSHGMDNAALVVCESRQLQDDLGSCFGVDTEKVRVIPQILPRNFMQQAEGLAISAQAAELKQPYLFYPAQLWEHKNHGNLLRALALLAPDFPNLSLVLAGSRKVGDDRIFQQADQLGLRERITYLGYVPDADMPTLYRRATALIMPTFCGPTNIPTLEAFYFGCPAVISDLPGVKEQVGEDGALLFDPSDPSDMAAKLRMVLTDPSLAPRMIKAGQRRLEFLSYENYERALFEVFDEILFLSSSHRGKSAASRG